MLSPLGEVCHSVIDHTITHQKLDIFVIALDSDVSDINTPEIDHFSSPYKTEISETKFSLTLWTFLLASKLLDCYSLRYP